MPLSAVQARMHGQVHHMTIALQAAEEGRGQWRERALAAERQFDQLRGMIEARLQEASEAVVFRQQLGQEQEQDEGKQLPQINCRMREKLAEGQDEP
jgi:hypothetical protein